MKKYGLLFILILAIFMLGACHTHEAGEETWQSDEEYHYKTCDSCGEVFDKELHTWDDGYMVTKPTESREGLITYFCTVCGEYKEEVLQKLPHTHTLAEEYENDLENHYKTCSKCFEKTNVGAHDYDDGTSSTVGSTNVTTYKCKVCGREKVSIDGKDFGGNILDLVSDEVNDETLDFLPTAISDTTYEWSSSNNNAYQIDGFTGHTEKRYQTHKTQNVTITVKSYKNGEVKTESKEIKVLPVVFEEIVNPKTIYFAQGSYSNYANNSTRFKQSGELFSDTFKENMNMIYYSFAYPASDGTVSLSTTALDEVMELKNHGIRVILVIAGVSASNLQALTVLSDKDNTRKALAKTIVDLVEKYNFDGVDMDWEFPGLSGLSGYTTEIDKINLNKLMKDLRDELDLRQEEGGSKYILSAAIPASSWGSARYQFKDTKTVVGLNSTCDYINMMSYDANNGDYCTHIAPCYSSTQSHDFKFGCVWGTSTFTSMGLDKNKIILGAACYGKTYKVSGTVSTTSKTPALNNAGTLSIIDGVSGSFKSGTIYYTVVYELMKNSDWKKYTEYNNNNIVGSYLYNSKLGLFVTYDSEESIKAKCKYAKDNGMGIMAWAYGEDSTDTVVNTICEFNW